MSNARNLANLLVAGTDTLSDTINGKVTLDGSSAATVTVNSAVSSSATIAVDGVSGTIAVGMVVNVSDTTVRSISDASSETAVSVDDTLTITAVASQTSFTVSEAVSIADNVVLILRADENSKMVLDASADSIDVGEEILFEDATSDGSIAANNVAPTLIDVVGSLSNTMTTKSEGGAVTQNLVQGLVKAWFHIVNGAADPIALGDSFNATSISDGGTGTYNFNIANDMANANYSLTMGSQAASGFPDKPQINSQATGSFQCRQGHASGVVDAAIYNATVNGDLA